MERQLAKWDRSVLDLLDLVFLDAPYIATGESDVEGLFPPPFFEWFQYDKTEIGAVNYKTLKECIRVGEVTYRNLKECIQFISDFMETQGPFDGLLGFSQGSILSAALAGMQQQGLALTSVPALRLVIIISGGVLKGDHECKGCYSEPIRCPSVHLIGENDALKTRSEHLLLKFEDPVVVRTGAKHTVPRLDEKAALPIKAFLEDVIVEKNKTI